MKKLTIIFALALIFGLMSGPSTAMDFDMVVSNLYPGTGETIEVEIKIDNWAGTELKTFDFCFTYDATVLDVNSMQINDTGVGGCAAAFFSITDDNDTDCLRLGGGIMPGTTCNVADDYLLATVVFDVLNTDAAEICTSSECQSEDGCGWDFDGYIEDDTGKQYPLKVCANLNPPVPCVLSIDPPSATIPAGGVRQFTAIETGDCEAPDYVWTDTCVYGDVDSNGLFTADEEIEEEDCTVCVADNNNPETVEACADVTVEEKIYYYVDGTTGSNSNDGLTPGTAWKTITYALSQVTGTQEEPAAIQVAVSTYDTVMGGGDAETFPLFMKKYVSLRGESYENTIIDAEQTNNVIEFTKEEISEDTIVIEGFTITGGSNFRGAGITVLWTDPTIRNCLVTDNDSTDINGGGIYLQRSNALITNCIISNNTALQQRGGGISCGNESDPDIINCTIVYNGAGCGTDEGGGGISIGHNSSATVINSILWGNYRNCSPDPEPNQLLVQVGGILDITYSCIEGGYSGTGNTDADPKFIGAGYLLAYDSSCIDAGTSDDTPTADIDGNGRYDACAVPNTGGGAQPYFDMGALEYQGDTDGDGIMDDGDGSCVVGDNPCTDGATTDCDDNCVYIPNSDQVDNDVDGSGNVCDNCIETPNGLLLGTCAETRGVILRGTGVICADDGDCGSSETCQKNQEDCNDNDVGDACECYADFDGDGSVYPSDISILLSEYGREDCYTTPCQADINGDGMVYPSDLSIFLAEYGREDCPLIP